MSKNKLVVLMLTSIFLTGCFNKQQYGALSVSSGQNASLQIDGKDVGSTPYKEDKLLAGQATIRLVPQDSSLKAWEGVVDVNPGARTLVTRELASTADKESGEILSMEKTGQAIASTTIVSDPDGAMVKLDGEALGPTPLEKSPLSEGDHELIISAPGYVERVVRFKSQNGYKVQITVDLKKVDLPIVMEPEESTSSATPSGTLTPSPKVSTTPTPKVTGSATTSPTPTKASSSGKQMVKILTTPTGWLRVRSEASVNSEEVARVNPGETYELLDESSGWYQVDLGDGKKGWVAGQYAQKI